MARAALNSAPLGPSFGRKSAPLTLLFTTPLWRAPFRPFYGLGAAYAILLAASWLASTANPAQVAAWHGHEMLFGMATAIVSGILLTALPSWAGTPEWQGGRLAALVALWLAGRLGFWCDSWPLPLRALLDLAYFPVLILLLLPQLWRLADRRFLWLLPILGGFAGAQGLFWLGNQPSPGANPWSGLQLGLHALLLLFVVKGGLLTPLFTGNALRERGLGDAPSFLPELEYACAIAVLLLALTEPLASPPLAHATVCCGAAILLGFRCWRWRGWQVADLPMLAAMHIAFVWLIAALLLRGFCALHPALPQDAWQHAFLVGALGPMMLSLMNRVSLRHTGRALGMAPPMRAALGLMSLAAVLRVAAALGLIGSFWTAGAMALWASAFAIYLFVFAPALLAPSLPRPDTEAAQLRLKRESP